MSMMRRRIISIVAAALALVILGFALAGVLEYVKITEYVDVDNETKYYSRNRDGEYKLYAKGSKEPLPVDEQYGYYVTALGTLVSVDSETGEILKFIPVDDIEINEKIGFNDRVLVFRKIEKGEILSIEVHNAEGSFTFCRMNEDLELDPKGTFVIKESPFTAFNLTLAEQLYNNTGYPLSTYKIKDPIKDANGEFTEYGLAPAVRERKVVDEETGDVTTETYDYVPAYYIITDIEGNRHKIIVGDPLVTGGGYYVQYVDLSGETEAKRDAVYVFMASIAATLLVPVETYVTPMVCYPLEMNNYYDVENFVIGNRISDKVSSNYDEMYKRVISFTYVDLADRENTASSVTPYEFQYSLEGYKASDSAVSSCLYNLYEPSTIATTKFKPTQQDLVDYGLMSPVLDSSGNPLTDGKGNVQYAISAKHVISYNYDILNSTNNGVEHTIHQQILISDRDYAETGNYYTYSVVYRLGKDENGNEIQMQMPGYYDLIAEVDGAMFAFLDWDEYDWVDSHYVNQNIAFIDSIKVTAGDGFAKYAGYEAFFDLDNSLSAEQSSDLFVNAKDSLGNNGESFGRMEIYDSNRGHLWVVTSSGLKVYDYTSGTELKINKEYTFYDYNDLDQQVYCRTGNIGDDAKSYISKIWVNGKEIPNAEGAKVAVTANEVKVTYRDGSSPTTYVRYETELFRKYYQTYLYASLVDSYELTEAEEQALINDPSKHLLTIEVVVKDAESAGGKVTTDVIRFYRLSSRKAYITVNGNGGFYVYTNRVEKFITDAQRYFALQPIEPDGKK